MLDRREFLSSGISVAFLGITGCMHDVEVDIQEPQDGEPDNEEGNESEDGEDENGEDEEPVLSAEFEVVGIDVPDEVRLDEKFRFRVRVSNTGNETDFFRDELGIQRGGEWIVLDELAREIGAGETRFVQSRLISFDFLGVKRLRLMDRGNEVEVVSDDAFLESGEWFNRFDGVNLRVRPRSLSDIRFASSYVYEKDNGELAVQRAGEDRDFVFVYVEVENNSGRRLTLPSYDDFALLYRKRQYEPIRLRSEVFDGEERYRSLRVNDGVSEEGWVAFELPDTVRYPELTFTWGESFPDGDVGVKWVRSK